MTSTATERTQAIAITEVRYAINYAARHEAFWGHVDTSINLVNAMAGSAAFASLLANGTTFGAIAGGVIAMTSCVALVMRPAERAGAFRDFKRQFAALGAIAHRLSLGDIDGRLKVMRQDAPRGFDSLDAVVWNDTMSADGHASRIRQLTRFERVMKMMA